VSEAVVGGEVGDCGEDGEEKEEEEGEEVGPVEGGQGFGEHFAVVVTFADGRAVMGQFSRAILGLIPVSSLGVWDEIGEVGGA
jgi:hypothetical protein